MRFKKWIPGVMLGAMMAAKVTVPVMADNINSGSTPPRSNFRRLVVPVRIAVLEVTVGKFTTLRIQKLPVWLLLQRTGMTVLLMMRERYRIFPLAQKNPERVHWVMGLLITETD